MKRRILPLLLLVTGAVLALVAAVWENNFFPSERVEILNPAGRNNRAFTRADGFVDISIELCAVDWPYSFSKPVVLGDVYSEGFPVYRVRWSGDGSVIGLSAVAGKGSPETFQAAYDYKAHKVIKATLVSPAATNLNEEITALMASRGGMREAEPGIDDGKASDREKFPAWGWLPPLAVFALFTGATIMIRKRMVKATRFRNFTCAAVSE